MADIELVIKIPEEVYKSAKNGTLDEIQSMYICGSIVEGTPLPKEHGELIDKDVVLDMMNYGILEEYITTMGGVIHADR